ncbi:MAG TPA: Gfo/Idh/MocA family oxidoreductase, partial [Reyranella sp.]|nr:Gfo/Idh/MocA family oxidoreductase [Reyranella sp.]
MTHLGVGLIGTGYMGKCHALAWTSVHAVFGDVPSIDLVHLSEITDDLARTRATEFGFDRSGADWRALVTDPDVDIVSITTPNQFHAEMAIAALEAGKHVWCEKPMATSLADAGRMRDAARAAGRVAALGYNYIQNPMVRQIEAILSAGTIGTPNHFRVEMDEDFMSDPAAPFGWKSDAKSGYGALDDFGVHPVSLIHTLLGR